MEEKGFTSTMVGNPSNRLDGYVMMGKSESIYKRTGGKTVENGELGSAMRIEIVIPEGTKLAVVEPVRRIEYEYPRKVVPCPIASRTIRGSRNIQRLTPSAITAQSPRSRRSPLRIKARAGRRRFSSVVGHSIAW